ncbi:DUF4097 family beta strand repeat-containing protein [Streptomyces sp. SCSIO 75703]|uniref:DUF4097 family beta strand repeat-containing protein n=1 Tax=unclassified Streptomyces TaxID=2593676 RepID=UPI0004BE9BEF|nr:MULTISPECIES: DUF4097 family beta strand repeat-containing protein [unclassified Streptomyces]
MTVRTVPARALAAAGTVAVLLAGLVGCASAEDDKDPEHRSFALPGKTLTVDSDDAALEVVAGGRAADGRIEVTRWFSGSVTLGKDPEVSWRMTEDRLVLRMRCSGFIADCSARYRIEVPRGVAVTVRDGDGSVRASGFRDPLDIRTKDGSLHVTDSTGPLRLRTDDGSLRAEVSARRVDARTGDGSVRLTLGAVPDGVRAQSGDGSVSVTVPEAAYKLTTRTGDGSVRADVRRDDASPHVLDVRTKDGSITVRTAD